jgi:hypothetical protein
VEDVISAARISEKHWPKIRVGQSDPSSEKEAHEAAFDISLSKYLRRRVWATPCRVGAGS